MSTNVRYESEVMSLTEAAVTLDVTARTVRRWCASGAVPTVTLPSGRRAILREDLRGVVVRNYPLHADRPATMKGR